MNIILEAVVGSQLYGLQTEDSDEDILGVFIAPNRDILNLQPPKQTYGSVKPDKTYHELEKFMRLASKCNPTVLEILYCPTYNILKEEGRFLITNREYFLSKQYIFDAFGGYAKQQLHKFENRLALDQQGFGPKTSKRYNKHARHMYRLLLEGQQLLKDGEMNPVVTDPERVFAVGQLPFDELKSVYELEIERMQRAYEISKVPDKPNIYMLNEIMWAIRGC